MADEIRILHVDDEPSITDLTAQFLERENDRFSIETATSADEGLAVLAERRPDCIVSDYDMPGMSGIEFLEAVRTRAPELPFILYTGKGSEEVASEAISAGVTDYIQKGSGTERYLLLANRIENAVAKHRSQQTAKQQKKRLELLFQESPFGAIQWDDEFSVKRLNKRATEILGYAEAELRGESWDAIVAPEDRGRVSEVVDSLLANAGGEHIINENVRADGEVVTCEWHNRVVTDSDGEVVSIFSKFRDITDKRRHETDLKRYKTIIEALTDAVYVIDERGRFTYVNDEFVDLVGYDRETILGNTPSLIKDDEAVSEAETQLGRLLSSDGPDTLRFEVTIHPRDGDPITCQDHMGVLPYDGEWFNGSVGVLRDITDQKDRERELTQVQDLMSKMEAMADVGAWEYDPEAETLVTTDGTLRVFGLDADVDLSLEEVLEHIHPDDREELSDRFTECLRTGRSYELTVRLITAEGTRRWATVRGERVNAYGSEDVMRGYIQDVTEHREYERELESHNEQLEEFAGIVSHDLRSPLSVAQGSLELARETHESDHLRRAADAVDRSQTLVDDLLTLARQGETAAEFEPVEVAEVSRRCWQGVETKRATLDVDVDPSLTIRADRSRLRELLENLYRNAIKHGGDAVTVHVGALDDGFYVADTGSGIPEDDCAEVFRAGYSTADDGTGFGLRIVEQVVDAHGWEVDVTESTQGGARFEITGVERADR